MLSENEKATLELSRSLEDISDYRELWQVYQQTISKIFPIDWLGIYSTPVKGEIYNVTLKAGEESEPPCVLERPSFIRPLRRPGTTILNHNSPDVIREQK
jgi:hypothetical protein